MDIPPGGSANRLRVERYRWGYLGVTTQHPQAKPLNTLSGKARHRVVSPPHLKARRQTCDDPLREGGRVNEGWSTDQLRACHGTKHAVVGSARDPSQIPAWPAREPGRYTEHRPRTTCRTKRSHQLLQRQLQQRRRGRRRKGNGATGRERGRRLTARRLESTNRRASSRNRRPRPRVTRLDAAAAGVVEPLASVRRRLRELALG